MTTSPQKIFLNAFFYFVSIMVIDYVLKSISVKENRNESDLTMFDQRNGYSHEQALSLLTAWGSKGRFIYLIILTIDSFGFIVSYGSLLKWLFQWCNCSDLSWLVVLLTYADYAENVGHAAMTISFTYGYGHGNWFQGLVKCSSCANMTKWVLAKSCLCTLAIYSIYKNCNKTLS